jgi:DNA-binding HxlR family transcriptional regulator
MDPPDLPIHGCCPFQEAIDLLSKRHAMTIVWLLQQAEPRRFNEIKRALDINPVTLTQRLGEMEAAGVVARKTFQTSPPKVEYRLTEKGRALVPLLDQLSAWAEKYPQPSLSAVAS